MSALDRFRSVAWSALRQANQLSIEEHARRAHRVGGPSIEELERRIRAYRAGRTVHPIAA